MNRKAEYKSAIRSRKMIRHAFVELTLEKQLEKITVKNIVERAEISRGTFYAHYADIYALVEEIENEIMGKMIEILDDYRAVDIIEDPAPFLSRIAQFYEQDIELYRMLIHTDGAPTFITKLKEIIIEKLLRYQEKINSREEREEFILRVHLFVGGLTILYQDWFAGKFDCSLQELASSASKMIYQGLESFHSK